MRKRMAEEPNDIEVKITTWHDPDGAALRARQRDEILTTHPEKPAPGQPLSADDVPVIVLIKASGKPVAGVGLQPLPLENLTPKAEMKRMYVIPECRGRQHGIADLLMRELEREAAERGFVAIVLSTGVEMVQARRFYERHG